MSSSITDEEYEAAQAAFFELVKKEFSSNDNSTPSTKGSGRTSGISVVTSSRIESITKYLQLLEEAESEEDHHKKSLLMKKAKSVGKIHWKAKYRLKDNNGTTIIQTLGDIALKNHNVKQKKELTKVELTEEDYVTVLPIDTEECFSNLFSLHQQDHNANLYQKSHPIYDCNYSYKLCRLIKECCPTCKTANPTKSKNSSTSLFFSVLSFDTNVRGILPSNILLLMVTRKQYYFLLPIFNFSWYDVSLSIVEVCLAYGYPQDIRYIRDPSVLLSEEEANLSKNLTIEQIEHLVIQNIHQFNGGINTIEPWTKSRFIGTGNSFKKCSNYVREFATHHLNKDVSSNRYLLLKRVLPTLQRLINDDSTLTSHSKSIWINGNNRLHYENRRENNGLEMLSAVSCTQSTNEIEVAMVGTNGNQKNPMEPGDNDTDLSKKALDDFTYAQADVTDITYAKTNVNTATYARTDVNSQIRTDESTYTHTNVNAVTNAQTNEKNITNVQTNVTEPSRHPSQSMNTKTPESNKSTGGSNSTSYDQSPSPPKNPEDVEEDEVGGTFSPDTIVEHETRRHENTGTSIPERTEPKDDVPNNIYLVWEEGGHTILNRLTIPNYSELVRKNKNTERSGSFFVGIYNRGNQCFCIATVHLLFMMPEILLSLNGVISREYFQLKKQKLNTNDFKKKCRELVRSKPMSYAIFFTGMLMRKANLKRMDSSKRRTLNIPLSNIFPVEMVKNKKMNKHFGEGTQEDAHEFLIQTINMIIEENEGHEDDDDDVGDEFFDANYHPREFMYNMKKLLNIKWTDKCIFTCKHQYEKENDPEIILSLPLPTVENFYSHNRDVKSLLDTHFEDGDVFEQRQCRVCNQNKDFVIKRTINLLGDFLIVHLKRFYLNEDNVTVKNDLQINANLEMEIAYDDPAETYKLVAAICHEGNYSTGHYTAFLVEKRNNNLIFNMLSDRDHVVVSEEEFKIYTSKRAYLLLYKKNEYEKAFCNHFCNLDMEVEEVFEAFCSEYRAKNPKRKAKQTRLSDNGTTLSLTKLRKSNKRKSND